MRIESLVVSVVVVSLTACGHPPPPHHIDTDSARLLTAEIDPAAGFLYWLPGAALAVDFEAVPGLEVEVVDEPAVVAETPDPDIHRVALVASAQPHVLRVTAPKGTPPIEVRVALDADAWEQLLETRIDSPIVRLPGGEPLFDVDGLAAYGFDPREGIGFLAYLELADLFEAFCVVGADGPRPPTGSEHKKNYCGISAFIHSMQRTFPGALPADAGTNAASWDGVGDNLDHSNTFGERPGKMVDEINDNYGTSPPRSRDGKRYCATELDDTSAANLGAWAEDCDLKMCILDVTSVWGHWVDITGVDAGQKKLSFQDYEDTGTVNYSEDSENVDFSSAPNTTMGRHFNGTNTTAGDGIGETVTFVAVCACDTSSSDPKMPSTNSKGQTLAP